MLFLFQTEIASCRHRQTQSALCPQVMNCYEAEHCAMKMHPRIFVLNLSMEREGRIQPTLQRGRRKRFFFSYLSKLKQALRVQIFIYKAPKYNGQAGHKTSREYNSEETEGVKLREPRFKQLK